MPGHIRRARKRAFVRLAGELPDCLGHYLQTDAQCDGPPGPPSAAEPCAWRNVCRRYKEACRLRGVQDTAAERALMTPARFLDFVLGLATVYVHPNDNLSQARALRAWDRFAAALGDALPALPVAATMAAALPGEVYVHTWLGTNRPGRVRCKLLRVRVGGPGHGPGADVTLLKFWPTFTSKVAPTIEFRADQAQVLRDHPGALALAVRASTHGEQPHAGLGFALVRVHPEHVGDVARLFAAVLLAGQVRGVTVRGGGTWLETTGR